MAAKEGIERKNASLAPSRRHLILNSSPMIDLRDSILLFNVSALRAFGCGWFCGHRWITQPAEVVPARLA